MKEDDHLPSGFMIEIDNGHSFLFGCCGYKSPYAAVHRIVGEIVDGDKIRLTVYLDEMQSEIVKSKIEKGK